jgi:hypothetical protein
MLEVIDVFVSLLPKAGVAILSSGIRFDLETTRSPRWRETRRWGVDTGHGIDVIERQQLRESEYTMSRRDAGNFRNTRRS